MNEYQYTNNGSEITGWFQCGTGCGKTLDACLTEARLLGLTWKVDDLPEAPMPTEIPNWRAKAVLELAGLLPTVEAMLAAMTGPEGVVARAAWTAGAPLSRSGPTVLALTQQLGLTDAQVDAMFRQAVALEV